jgi:hypothetical protein
MGADDGPQHGARGYPTARAAESAARARAADMADPILAAYCPKNGLVDSL